MPVHALGDIAPDVHPDAFAHPEAVAGVDHGVKAYVAYGRRYRGGMRRIDA